MNYRMKKIDKHIQRTFGEILQKEADMPADVLVTISRVETAANLAMTTIWLYVYPLEQATEILDHLKPQLYDLQGAFNRMLDLRPLPRIRLRIDYGAEYAETIDKTLDQLGTG